MEELLGTIIGAVLTFALGFWKYKDEKKRNALELENLQLENEKLKNENCKLEVKDDEQRAKIEFYDDVLKMVFYNSLSDAVYQLFEKTKVDRFLVLLARNGKERPRYVDVMLEFHKTEEHKIEAVKIYKNVKIDSPYNEMIDNTFHNGFCDIETAVMQEQILKYFYLNENIHFSRTKPIIKKQIDDDRVVKIFTSSATHQKDPYTINEKTTIDLYHDSLIVPAIKNLLK